jgi:hypothetical protein
LGLTKVEISSAIEKRTNAANPARISDFLIVTVTVVEPPPRNSSLNFIQIKNTGGGDWLLDSVDRTYPYYYDREELEKSTRQDQHGTPIIEFADGPDGAHSDVTTFFYLAVVEVKRECIRPRRDPVTQTPVLVGNLIRHRVSVLADIVWSFNMYRTPKIIVGTQSTRSNSMVPTLQKTVENKTFTEPWVLPFTIHIVE